MVVSTSKITSMVYIAGWRNTRHSDKARGGNEKGQTGSLPLYCSCGRDVVVEALEELENLMLSGIEGGELELELDLNLDSKNCSSG